MRAQTFIGTLRQQQTKMNYTGNIVLEKILIVFVVLIPAVTHAQTDEYTNGLKRSDGYYEHPVYVDTHGITYASTYYIKFKYGTIKAPRGISNFNGSNLDSIIFENL